MHEIDIYPSGKNKSYFMIGLSDNNCLCTSEQIARFLNLPIRTYNDLLIKKVIRHDDYRVIGESRANRFDLDFNRKGIDKSVYIERFKETFLEELTLALLGGGELC